MRDYTHPVLGVFEREPLTTPLGQRFLRLQRRHSTDIAGLGYNFSNLWILLEDRSDPAPAIIGELIHLIDSVSRSQIEAPLLAHYRSNRDRNISELQDNDVSDARIAKLVPNIDDSFNIFQIIERGCSISVGVRPQPCLSFDTIYDEAHELHLSCANGEVVEIWDE